MLHDFSHVLSMLPGRNQKGVVCFDNHKIADADRRHELSRRVDIIPLCVQREDALARNQIAILGCTFCNMMLVKCSPGAKVIPPKVRGQAKNI